MKQDNQRQAFLYSYMAGIIDGEGSITISKTLLKKYPQYNPIYRAGIGIGMTEKCIIQLFADEFGGNIYTESVLNRKPMYRWSRSGNSSVIDVLKTLLPFLIAKRNQAELLIDFCEGYKRNIGLRRKCTMCQQKIRKIHGYGLCVNCYPKAMRRGTLHEYDLKSKDPFHTPIEELRRRERLYLELKSLHKGGAVAETK